MLEVDSCCTSHLCSVVNTEVLLEWSKRFLSFFEADSWRTQKKAPAFSGDRFGDVSVGL